MSEEYRSVISRGGEYRSVISRWLSTMVEWRGSERDQQWIIDMMNLEKYRGVIRGEFPTTDEGKVSKRDQPWIPHMMRETIRAWSAVDVRP